ncbi:MAG: hypothetical protein H6Q65_310 [Firmicutes bacterium]|nr:hypothetical protein [Bacillota bacterium]
MKLLDDEYYYLYEIDSAVIDFEYLEQPEKARNATKPYLSFWIEKTKTDGEVIMWCKVPEADEQGHIISEMMDYFKACLECDHNNVDPDQIKNVKRNYDE